MMSKHTPGPWQVHSAETEYDLYIVGNVDGPLDNGEMNYTPVCDVADTKDADANLRLICAAPALLRALINVLPLAREAVIHPSLCVEIIDAHAAIAKATS
jgi:hypothetical protein